MNYTGPRPLPRGMPARSGTGNEWLEGGGDSEYLSSVCEIGLEPCECLARNRKSGTKYE